MLKPTPGNWRTACDSYGKVQHSRKYNCVFTTVNEGKGDLLINVAARIPSYTDARIIEAAPRMLRFVTQMASQTDAQGEAVQTGGAV